MWEVVKNDERALYFGQQTKTVEYRHKKFLANDQELEEMVLDIAKRSSLKDRLNLLDPHDQETMGRRLAVEYGPKCANDLNAKRRRPRELSLNALPKAKWSLERSSAKLSSARQGIFLYDEDVSDNEQAKKNKSLNLKNQRWRDVFDKFNDKFIGNCLGTEKTPSPCQARYKYT